MASFRQSLRDVLRSFSAVDPSTERSTRGMQLLTRNLSLAQRKQYAMHGYFDVTSSDTGKRYRIRHGCMMDVEQLNPKGRRISVVVFHPNWPTSRRGHSAGPEDRVGTIRDRRPQGREPNSRVGRHLSGGNAHRTEIPPLVGVGPARERDSHSQRYGVMA